MRQSTVRPSRLVVGEQLTKPVWCAEPRDGGPGLWLPSERDAMLPHGRADRARRAAWFGVGGCDMMVVWRRASWLRFVECEPSSTEPIDDICFEEMLCSGVALAGKLAEIDTNDIV